MIRPVRCLFAVLLSLSCLMATSCSKPKTTDATDSKTHSSPTAASKTQSTPAPSDYACTLLTREDIQAVQGETFKETKPSERSVAGLTTSQCYFELPTAANSIVLTITRKADGGRDPRQSWQEIFHGEKRREKKEEEEKQPLKIEGIGEEAFWTGSRVSGALYVLKANCYIRISVGGAGTVEEKMEKSKTLAQSVLKRL